MLSGSPPLLDLALRLAAPAADTGGVELWLLRVDRVEPERLDASPLDDDERRHAARLGRKDLRTAYLASHLLLRHLLARRLGVAPDDIAYAREACPACGGPHGRPVLAGVGPGTHFSLSRRGDLALVGLASTPVGADVEALPDQGTVEEVSALLHDDERAAVARAARAERPGVFARIWTRKEAYLKGLGVGLARGLAAEDVGTRPLTAPAAGWSVLNVDAPRDYAVAVAVRACRPPGSLGHEADVLGDERGQPVLP